MEHQIAFTGVISSYLRTFSGCWILLYIFLEMEVYSWGLNVKEIKCHTDVKEVKCPVVPAMVQPGLSWFWLQRWCWRASADKVCVAKAGSGTHRQQLAGELKLMCLWVRRAGNGLRAALRMLHRGRSLANCADLPKLSVQGQPSRAQHWKWIAGRI